MRGAATPAGLAMLLTVLVSGCGGPPPARPPSPTLLLGTPIEVVNEEGDAPEPDLAPRDRWAAPFAVSSAGEITPNEPRSVIVLSADPAIEAGLEVQREIEARLPRRTGPGTAQPVSASGAAQRAMEDVDGSRGGPAARPNE